MYLNITAALCPSKSILFFSVHSIITFFPFASFHFRPEAPQHQESHPENGFRLAGQQRVLPVWVHVLLLLSDAGQLRVVIRWGGGRVEVPVHVAVSIRPVGPVEQ